jgi:hypothetical protein
MESVVMMHGTTNRARVIRRIRRLQALQIKEQKSLDKAILRGIRKDQMGHDIKIMVCKRIKAIKWAISELRSVYNIEWDEIDLSYVKSMEGETARLQRAGTTTNTDTPQ